MNEVEHKELNTKHAPNRHEVVIHRRELVARLRIRGLSLRELVQVLAGELINPQSGQAFTLITIQKDCKALDRQWLEASLVSTETLKARVHAEIKEVKRAAWRDKDLNVVLKALKQECDLLGLDAPAQINLNLLQKRAQEAAERFGMTADEMLQKATKAVLEVGGEDEA